MYKGFETGVNSGQGSTPNHLLWHFDASRYTAKNESSIFILLMITLSLFPYFLMASPGKGFRGLETRSVMSSKLDPNSKPFSPRQSTPRAGSAASSLESSRNFSYATMDTSLSSEASLLMGSDSSVQQESERDDFGLRGLARFLEQGGRLADDDDDQDQLVKVQEYKLSSHISKMMNASSLADMPTDKLFQLFYFSSYDEVKQLTASALLQRGWRFSKSYGVWLARKKNVPPLFSTDTYEFNTFQVYNFYTRQREDHRLMIYCNDLLSD